MLFSEARDEEPYINHQDDHLPCAGAVLLMNAEGRIGMGEIDNNDEADLEVDKLVANALNSLSLEERQRNLNDQHGVPDQVEETPEFVTQKLNELQNELFKQLATRMGGPYLWHHSISSPPPGIIVAQSTDPNFVSNTYQLRLRVLRAEYYDAAKAATRMIRHFDLKLKAFGPDKICKKIAYEDLNQDDVDALNKGFFQYLQGRDMSGRRMFAFFPSHVQVRDPLSLIRLFFYYDTFVDNNKLDKGYIVLSFRLGPPTKDSLDFQNLSIMRESFLAYPGSPSAFHLCYPDHAIHKLIFLLLPQSLRAKITIHVGSQTMWFYELMSYGITQDVLPISHNGDLKLKSHHAFIQYRKRLQEVCALNNPCFSSAIEVPNNEDVLFGKGRPFQNHKGNVRLRFLVAISAPLYDTCPDREEKAQVIEDVLNQIKSSGGRFLSQQPRLWTEVNDLEAREKVSQMFRNVRKQFAAITSTTIRNPTTSAFNANSVSLVSTGGLADGSNQQKHNDVDGGGKRAVTVSADNPNNHVSESRKRPCFRNL